MEKEYATNRLAKYASYRGIAISAFEKSIGKAPSYLRNSKDITSSVLQKLMEVYPDLSIDWVITGQGLMIKSDKLNDRTKIEDTTVKARFKHLAEKHFGSDLKLMSENLNIQESRLSEILTDDAYLEYSDIINLNDNGVNIGWLLGGHGNMTISEIPSSSASKNTIKYYPAVSGSMGGVQFLDDPEESYVDIILPGFSECKYAMNAYGDSMHPVIKSGQVVILMEWTESFIDWGRIYLVVTKSGYRIIKYLKPSDNADAIRCESENKELNPAFDINKEDIHKLFLVKGWVCRDTI